MTGEVWVGVTGIRVALVGGKVVQVQLLPLRAKPLKGGPKYKIPKGPSAPALKNALKQAAEYLQGKRRRFNVPVDQKYATPFHEKVYKTLMTVPYGRVVSYGELARLAGAPGAARAVGTAMKRNQLCLYIPCHRVVAANGIGGYNGQIEWKRLLLDLEKRT